MAQVNYIAILPKIRIKDGGSSFDNTIKRSDCAEFITNYPETMLKEGVYHRTFEIDMGKNHSSRERVSKSLMLFEWWREFLGKNFKFEFVEYLGMEGKSPRLIFTVKNVEEENSKIRQVIYKQALLEFSLFRYAWGRPYCNVISHLFNNRELIEKSKYDIVQYLFVYSMFLRMRLKQFSYNHEASWSQYFSLVKEYAAGEKMLLPTIQEFDEMLSYRTPNGYFNIFDLTSGKIIPFKESLYIKPYYYNAESKGLFSKRFEKLMLDTNPELSAKLHEETEKFIDERRFKKSGD